MPGQTSSTSLLTFLFVRLICAAGIAIGSPGLHAQRGMGPSMSGLHSNHVIHGAPPVHTPNRISSPTHSAGSPFREHRGGHKSLGCVDGSGRLPAEQLLEPFSAEGFDFEHLTAVHSDWAIKAAIDPVAHLQLGEAERLSCRAIGPTGYLLLGGGSYVVPAEEDQVSEQAPAAQPSLIVLQQAASDQPSAQPTAPAQLAPPTLPDEGQFILVLRDGTQIQVFAFARSMDKVVYITTEGARRTLALSDLDVSATNRLNEERGTLVQLPI